MKVDSKKSGRLIFDPNVNTSGITFSVDLCENYSPEVIEKAAQLKAKYGNKYSDSFYLDYAQRACCISNIKRATALFKLQANCLQITDPEWSGYSYEEIIQMKNDGYVIPKEVLIWAYSQEEADITSYQIISTTAESDDGSSTEEITNDSDINNIEKKAKEFVIKAQKAKIETERNVEEFNNDIEKANSIKQQKEDTYKDSIQLIKNYTKEWKKFDEKSKNTTLTSSEQSRYIELGEILNGKGNNPIKEVQQDVLQLNDLLNSISSYDNFTKDNLILSQDTIKAGVDLAKLDKSFPEEAIEHVQSRLIITSSGSLSDLLSAKNSSEIPTIATTLGTELEVQTNNFVGTLRTDEIKEIQEFAQEYSKSAQNTGNVNTVNKSKNSTTIEKQQSSNKTQPIESDKTVSESNSNTDSTSASSGNTGQNTQNSENSLNASESNAEFSAFPSTGNPVLAAATVTATASATDLAEKNNKADNMKTKSDKNLKNANQQTKQLEKANSVAEERHNGNMQTQEMYLSQLESARAKKLSEQKNEPSTGENTQDSSEEENIISQITSLSLQDRLAGERVRVEKAELQDSLTQVEKTSKTLEEQNDILKPGNKNNKNVGISTIEVGSVNLSSSYIMKTTALSLMSNSKNADNSIPVSNSYTGEDKQKILNQSQKEALAPYEPREMNIARILADEKDSVITQMEQVDNESQGVISSDKVDVILANNLSKSKVLKTKFDNLYSTAKNINIPSTGNLKPIQDEFDNSKNDAEKLIAVGTGRQRQSLKVSSDTSFENQNISKDDTADVVLDVVTKSDIVATLNQEPSEDDFVAAAATTTINGDINKVSVTSDKLERKLARFNNDSIIESKKKQRRVNSISASSGRKA